MVQGAAYDQVMKFIDPTTSFVKRIGRVAHGANYFTITPYQTGGLNYSSVYTGNKPYNDVAKNIYDLEGNVRAFRDVLKLKVMIKDYAKYLGLDPEKIVDEFNDFLFEHTSKISLEDILEAKQKKEEEEKKIVSAIATAASNAVSGV